MAIQFSKEQIVDRIKFENTWWTSDIIDDYYQTMKRRGYFQLFFPLITERSIKRAVVLMGPRRVGKTVLLYQSIQQLLNQGVLSKNIAYFSVDTPLYNGIALEELVQLFLQISGKNKSEELYVFFDEIQYLKNWEIHLKSLVDTYHHIKFIVSGSAAAALKLKSQESGAGRFTEFLLPPLTFQEFLTLTNQDHLVQIQPVILDDKSIAPYCVTEQIKELNENFIKYINYGGYPELSLSPVIQSNPGRYIRNDIIDKVLMRDLPNLYGIQDIQELNSLFTYLAYHSGSELSLDGIAKNAGVAKNTIKKYITYLEAAFLIKVIHRIDQNAKQFKRANFFKIYLTNPSLRSALFSPISPLDRYMGNMVETAIFAQWQHHQQRLYYARWKSGEIDIVGLNVHQKPDFCVEIKFSNRLVNHTSELKNIKLFCKKHQLKKVLITTLDINKTTVIDGVSYQFMPASVYCYSIGRI